eukprot:629199_1
MSNKRTIHRCTQQYVVIVCLVIIVFVMLMFHDIWYLSRNGVQQHTSESFPDQRQSLSITVKSSNKKNTNIALSLFSHHYKHCFYLDYMRDEKENGFTSRICQHTSESFPDQRQSLSITVKSSNKKNTNIALSLFSHHYKHCFYLDYMRDEKENGFTSQIGRA